jgi:Cytochrome c554 and c-prime
VEVTAEGLCRRVLVSAEAGMRVTSLIGLILGLLAVLNVFGQSDNQSKQVPLSPAPSPVAAPQANRAGPTRDSYVGDEACGSCHREKVDTFHQTAHYLTSRLPDRYSILGNLTAGANVPTSNPDLFFRIDQKENGFFQTAVQGTPPYTTERIERFGLVIGSGGKGQTYLFWKGDQLFQLPISYWTELGWVNSPGYRDGVANFDRPIIPRCLECHATYFESLSPPPNRYNTAGFAVGIRCEKCHGPGREHVQRKSSEVSGSSGSAILNPARFSRDRQIDLCAWCHAGHGVALARSFSYLPGEPLDKYIELPQPEPKAEVDVHGSQVELLEKSRCFQSSAMTCLTCHDVHTAQHDPSAFSQRCLNCHKPGTAMFPKLGHQVASNCIDCHMPRQETNLIVFDSNGKKARPQVRSHWIKIYPATTRSN